MLTVISPAKTLDFDSKPLTTKSSSADFLNQSEVLVSTMRSQSAKQLSKLMGISPKLAELNVERFTNWQLPDENNNAKQAILAFKGDVYLGLAVEEYNQRDFTFAQKNLRILSGLYGLLRPLDLILPYRLEMGTKIKNPGGKDLYEFWGDKITQAIQCELSSHRNKTLINLASIEYFKSINSSLLPGNIINPIFKDYSNGNYKILSFFAKKARGSMSSFIVKNRITKPSDLKSFDIDGYSFNDSLSTDQDWVFTRKAN
ncbi:MAG: peroxide stress protein YaaA [Pseudomonadales bacterium]|nr:peroxide stress protein YaaA [Pseudomonadales bacterium]